jgi:hypothetical protein
MDKAQPEGIPATPAQLLALAEVFEAEVLSLREDARGLTARIDRQQRLVNDLRREAEARGGRPFLLSAPAQPDYMVAHGNGKPGTSDAIIAVLEAKARPMSGTEVFEDLVRRDWLPADAKSPRNAVRASLWTLGKNGRIKKLGDTPASRRWAAKTASPNGEDIEHDEDVAGDEGGR